MTFQLGGQPIPVDLHPEVLALCLGLLAGYVGLLRKYGPVMHPRPGQPAATKGQKAAFVSGVALLWFASGSALHDVAEQYLYSAHMIQHLIQGFIVPPLLLMGVPTWMGEYLLRRRGVRVAVQRLSQPLIAALLFNGVLLLIHWPDVVDLMLASEFWHGASHVAMIIVGLFLWMNLVSPVPDIVPRLSPLQQMGYLILQTILPTIPATFLTFGDTPLYTAYETLPRMWGISALEDMRIAGLIMKVGGGFYLWGIIAVVFFRWAAVEERRDHVPRRPGPQPSDVATK